MEIALYQQPCPLITIRPFTAGEPRSALAHATLADAVGIRSVRVWFYSLGLRCRYRCGVSPQSRCAARFSRNWVPGCSQQINVNDCE
ncbi:hypothetical protein EYF80_002365 [Liparis tanakae]|uniref:Uncharacterized protein n=1 Tax=Liparis tanakae TaxID=230148 RepID=A0A4Z2JBN0_9TELE|nr:hypothetical protein EYF80_002365 [Liparis tanakae]